MKALSIIEQNSNLVYYMNTLCYFEAQTCL